MLVDWKTPLVSQFIKTLVEIMQCCVVIQNNKQYVQICLATADCTETFRDSGNSADPKLNCFPYTQKLIDIKKERMPAREYADNNFQTGD